MKTNLFLSYLYFTSKTRKLMDIVLIVATTAASKEFLTKLKTFAIEEGLNSKARQRSLRLFGGQNPCRASCLASVYLEQPVEFNVYSK